MTQKIFWGLLSLFYVFVGFAAEKTFEGKIWTVTIDDQTGAVLKLAAKERIVAENPSGRPSVAMIEPRLSGVELEQTHFDPETGILSLFQRCGFWTFQETFTLNNPRLLRELYLNNRSSRPMKFYQMDRYLYLPRKGTFFLPRIFLGDDRSAQDIDRDPKHVVPQRGSLAELPAGQLRKGDSDSNFIFVEQSPSCTLMLTADGAFERTRIMLEAKTESICAIFYSTASGWAEPGKPQLIGRIWLEILNCNADEALKIGPHRFFRDEKQLPPADRPAWMEDMIMSIGLPDPSYSGSADANDASVRLVKFLKMRNYNVYWLMPISAPFAYMPSDYHSVRLELGDKTAIQTFVRKAQESGIRVLYDYVPHGGYPVNAPARGLSPFALCIDENGQFTSAMSYDYGAGEYRDFCVKTARKLLSDYNFDGFKVDQCGFAPKNWRRPDFPAECPKNAPDREWWDAAVRKNGGKLPYLELPRASSNIRVAGGLLTGELRKTVRESGPDKLLLAEDNAISMPVQGDMAYTYLVKRIHCKMRVMPGNELGRRLGEYLNEMKYTDPPGAFRHVGFDDHGVSGYVSYLGISAYLSIRTAFSWSRVNIMDNFMNITGVGKYIADLNAQKMRLEELRRGIADYPPCANGFAVQRSMDGKAVFGFVNFDKVPQTLSAAFRPESANLKTDDAITVRDDATGKELFRGRAGDWNPSVELPAFGSQLAVVRKEGFAQELAPKDAIRPDAVPVPAGVVREKDAFRIGGLKISEKTGLPTAFGSLIDGCDILSDARFPAAGTCRVTQQGDMVKTILPDGLEINYTADGGRVRMDLTLKSFDPGERTAIAFASRSARRWQIDAMEGKLDELHHPDAVNSELPAFYHPFLLQPRSAVSYDSFDKPLLPGGGVTLIDEASQAVTIRPADPLSPDSDNITVLNALPGDNRLHVAFFLVQPGMLSLAKPGTPRRLSLFLEPASPERTVAKTFRAGNWEFRHDSLWWNLKHENTQIRLFRAGGAIEEFQNRKNGETAVSDLDFGLFDGKSERTATANSDTRSRLWVENGVPRLRFAGALGKITVRPLIYFKTDYALSADGAVHASWRLLDSGADLPQPFQLQLKYTGKNHTVLENFSQETPGRYFIARSIAANGVTPEPGEPDVDFADRLFPADAVWGIHSFLRGRLALMMQCTDPGNNIFFQFNGNARLQQQNGQYTLQVKLPCELARMEYAVPLESGIYECIFRFRHSGVRKAPHCTEKPIRCRLEYSENGKKKSVAFNQELPDGTSDGIIERKQSFVIPSGVTEGRLILAPYLCYGEGEFAIDLPQIKKKEAK